MSEDIENIWEARAEEFLERFTPPEAVEEWGFNAHGLLYDFKHKYHFTPTTTQLEECITAYVRLLEEVTSEHSAVILGIINASELALAYLIRAGEAKALSVSKDIRDQVAVLTRRIVTDVRLYTGEPDYDAVKRLISINEYLKGEVPSNREPDILKLKKAYEEEEARKKALEESILDYLRHNKKEAAAGAIWCDLEDRFSGSDIIGALLELTEKGQLRPDKELLRPSDMLRSTRFRLLE